MVGKHAWLVGKNYLNAKRVKGPHLFIERTCLNPYTVKTGRNSPVQIMAHSELVQAMTNVAAG